MGNKAIILTACMVMTSAAAAQTRATVRDAETNKDGAQPAELGLSLSGEVQDQNKVSRRGTIYSLYVNDKDSATYGAYRGYLEQSEKYKTRYYWGGAACDGEGISESHEAALLDAVAHQALLTFEYKTHRWGNLTVNCIVGFKMTRRSQ
ncbi:MAG: hypothetical protein AAF224_10545 [Pseudomonadota bacterium]